MLHQLKLEKFEGPLDLLLKLVEREKMEITEVNLASVTESYLRYLNQNQEISEEEMADFLVIVAKLLYLKSKALLPEPALEPEEGISLEDQLRIYKEFVVAAKKVQEILKNDKVAYFRIVPLRLSEIGFYPPKGLTGGKMRRMFAEVLERLKPWLELPRVALERIYSINEKIRQIQDLLAGSGKLNLQQILRDIKSRAELIITFLAVLEMTKQQHIVISQRRHFEEIIIESS